MYNEEQKITSRLLIIILLISSLITIIGFGFFVYQGYASGALEDMGVIYLAATIIIIVFSAVYLLIFRTTLKISIINNEIQIQYFPFLIKTIVIPFTNIQSWQKRKQKSIFDYGGFGYQKDIFKKQTGFIMSRDEIFEFKLLNGRTIAFTSSNKEMLYSELIKQLPSKEIK